MRATRTSPSRRAGSCTYTTPTKFVCQPLGGVFAAVSYADRSHPDRLVYRLCIERALLHRALPAIVLIAASVSEPSPTSACCSGRKRSHSEARAASLLEPVQCCSSRVGACEQDGTFPGGCQPCPEPFVFGCRLTCNATGLDCALDPGQHQLPSHGSQADHQRGAAGQGEPAVGGVRPEGSQSERTPKEEGRCPPIGDQWRANLASLL